MRADVCNDRYALDHATDCEIYLEHADDVVIQHSTGASAVPATDHHLSLRTDLPPEMTSLDMGPVNRYEHLTSENTRGMVDALHDEMVDRGIKPELEAFNPVTSTRSTTC